MTKYNEGDFVWYFSGSWIKYGMIDKIFFDSGYIPNYSIEHVHWRTFPETEVFQTRGELVDYLTKI